MSLHKRKTGTIFMIVVASMISFTHTAFAENKSFQTFGDIVIHYSAFPSSFLSAKVTKQYGLKRSSNEGVVNISVQKKSHEDGSSKPITAALKGEAKNLLSQVKSLAFKEVKEGDAIYYIANFHFDDKENLDFLVKVKTGTSDYEHVVKFNKQMFTKTQ